MHPAWAQKHSQRDDGEREPQHMQPSADERRGAHVDRPIVVGTEAGLSTQPSREEAVCGVERETQQPYQPRRPEKPREGQGVA